MNCDSAARLFSLFHYGELSFEEENLLHEHLEGCPACRQASEQEKTLHLAIDDTGMALPPGLLTRCRRDLEDRIALIDAAPARRGWRRWLDSISVGSAAIWKPAAAMALVTLGFFAARMTDTPRPAAPSNEPIASRVRYVEPDASGRVQIVFDETRQRILTGRLDEEPIRRLLLSAAKDPSDPGLRAESMDILSGRAESVEVRSALLHALQHDPNPGVRLKAIEGLKPYSADSNTRKTLAAVLLSDDNPGVRTQAIDLLVQNKEQALVGTLQELLRKEDNNYVRLRTQRALREMNASPGVF